MKSIALISLILFSAVMPWSAASGQSFDQNATTSQFVQPIYMQHVYEYVISATNRFHAMFGFGGKYEEVGTAKTSGPVFRGSFFLLRHPQTGEVLIVTAKHCLGLGVHHALPENRVKFFEETKDGKVDKQKVWDLKRWGPTVFLGNKSYGISAYGFTKDATDLVFLRSPQIQEIGRNSKTLVLSGKEPSFKSDVVAFGFNAPRQQQSPPVRISTVDPANYQITLNSGLDQGFSGGVLLDANDQVLGVIQATDANGKQTNCFYLKFEAFQDIEWHNTEGDVLCWSTPP